MVGTRKPADVQSIEALDRELIARGAQNLDEIFRFRDREGTPQWYVLMSWIKYLYSSTPSSSSNEMLSQIDTWTLARGLINKVRKEGIKKNRTRGVWYSDYRMDYFGIADEKVKKNAESVAAVIFSEDLIEEKKGMSRIRVKNYGKVFNLWDGENFRDQPISAGRMVTGFLVEKDVIATAAHYANMANVKKLRFVFGYKMSTPKSPIIKIHETDIYKGIGFIERVLNHSNVNDFALVRLDREVKGREVVRLSIGEIFKGKEIYVLGHPCGLPLKYAPGARVQHVDDNYFAADLDVYMGNSGSPVFRSDTHEVIGMVVRGNTQDFRWTGKGWATVIYPNREVKANYPQCTRASRFVNQIIVGDIGQVSSPTESERSKKKIFVSYSHKDKNFVDSLTTALENAGMSVWVDEKEIETGDSISKKIEEGISGCDFFCLVLSGHSVKSGWVKREYQAALNKQVSSGEPVILPLLIDDVELPLLLSDIKYADFSKDYESGLKQLLKAVKK